MGIYVLVALISLILGALIGLIFSKNFTAKLREDFKNIANQALIDNQNQLQQQNSLTLEDKLKPLGEALEKYQKEIGEFNKDSLKEATSLKTEITNLMANSKNVQEVAHRLANALTKNQNVKGQFGEDTLEVILNASGMSENLNYIKQMPVLPPGSMQTRFPDFVVKLTQGRHIIIDAKLNLESFIRYQNEDNNEQYLKDFKSEIKTTIKNLSEKKYEQTEVLNSPDFVLMYIPLENSLALLYEDTSVLEYANKHNVILVGTTSLLTTLRLVQRLLSDDKKQKHVMEIAKTGAQLYEKFVNLCDNLQNIRKHFQKVDAEFETSLSRLKDGRGNLFETAEKLKELGIDSKKQIPEEFLVGVAEE